MIHRRLLVAFVVSLASLFVLIGAKRRAVSPRGSAPPELILDRSFVITDEDVLAGFPFERTLSALIAQSDATGLTAESLFRQWMDTQNPRPGLDATMPHCDDFLTDGVPSHNGFPRKCPTSEGIYATKPFDLENIVPIAIVNRFDQADPAGSHCGQYRIIYADVTAPANDIFHIIFEGALTNPAPEAGLHGCRPVAQFWAELSDVASRSDRRVRLEQFFFEGLPGFRPLFHVDHFHRPPTGIRTLQRSFPAGNVHFLQFRLIHECAESSCRLFMKPDTLENVPFAKYFDARIDTPQARRLRDEVAANIPTLTVRDANLYFMKLSDEFLIADTQPDAADVSSFIFAVSFNAAKDSPEGQAFADRLAAEIAKAGSSITPSELIARAETQTCIGCHFIGGNVGDGVEFPLALEDHQHVSEDLFTMVDGQKRFAISPAMRDVFIPHRMKILRDFLVSGKAPVHSN